MNDDTDPPKKDYDVGYRKPPKRTQFKKGQSGNPKGRKKGSRSLKHDLDAALKEKHSISVAGKKRKGTTQELSMLTLALRAASGDIRAQALLVNVVLQVFGAGERGGDQTRLSNQDQLLLDRMLGRVEGQDNPPSQPDAPDQTGKADGDANDASGEQADG